MLIWWCGLVFTLVATAQESVQIYFDPIRRTADTLDFGYVMAGDSVLRQLFIENSSPLEVTIPQGIRPYIAIEPTPPFRDNDPDEFPLEALFPFRIAPGQTRAYPLRYTATLFPQHPAGRHQVALRVSVRSSADTANVVAERRIIMRATKSFRPLWSDQTAVAFDSVYVGSPFDRVQMVQVRNVYRQAVSAQIIRTGDARSMTAFTLDAETSDVFASEEEKLYRAQFRPIVPGSYALDVLFVHPSPLRNGGQDTTTVQLRGVGVVQQLQCRAALAPNVEIVGDTIIARYRAIGSSDTIPLVFQNVGNIPIGAIETQLDPSGSVEEVTIRRPFSQAANLVPQALDTVVLVVRPVRAGTNQVTLRLQTDLLQRSIYGAPSDAAQLRFTLRIESMPQRLAALQPEMDFGTTLALGSCGETLTDTVQLENRSDEPVTITALSVPPPFSVPVTTPVVVAARTVLALPIIVSPVDRAADVSGDLGIESSDSAYSPLKVKLRVRFVQPQPLSLQLQPVEYVPGETVHVLLGCSGERAAVYSAGEIELSLEPTMAELHGVQTANTALQGATVSMVSLGNGRYRVQFQSSQHFFARDTFAVLVLRTYLGQQPQSSVAITSFQTGSVRCPDAIRGEGAHATLAVEPFCGMGYKFPIVFPTLVMSDAWVVPEGGIMLDCWSDRERSAQLVCVSADGRTITQHQLSLRSGRQTIIVPVELAPGVYGLRLQGEHTSQEARRVVLVR